MPCVKPLPAASKLGHWHFRGADDDLARVERSEGNEGMRAMQKRCVAERDLPGVGGMIERDRAASRGSLPAQATRPFEVILQPTKSRSASASASQNFQKVGSQSSQRT
jgi:hypothetical protein